MKKSALIMFFLLFVCGMGLSAQGFEGRYGHAQELNTEEMEVNQIILTLNGNVYSGEWETALATGENASVVTLQNVVVDSQNRRITFEKDGQSHSGQFVDDGSGGYDLMLDAQTLYSSKNW